MKKIVAILGGCVFFILIFSMYLVLDQSGRASEEDLFAKTKVASNALEKMESEVKNLEKQISNSRNAIDIMSDSVGKDTSKKNKVQIVKDRSKKKDNPIKPKAGLKNDQSICRFSDAPSGHTADIRMLDVMDEIPFDNPDGGAWKQGWDVQYKNDAFDKDQLLVFVVPHLHNDPGWIKTVNQYYEDQTRHILDNVIDALSENRRRKFIWAEISYFSMWWAQADERRKSLAKEQIENGQLEIVTGGWVMNDEASPHYYAIIDHLIEGHQWLERNIGVKPKTGWAIDPFGHSPTMAYVLKRAGFDGMLIQRTHYSIKKYLAKSKNLEFMWRQNWDHSSSTDMLCHMMPFYSYDIPHTCGPDPKICCQFDFRRLPGGGHFCPWMVPPVEINQGNVAERAQMLLDQYRKKAQLYRNNIVLAPLGDDFRYEITFETQKQYANYQLLMDYINNHSELKAKVVFGTLSDYFNAVWKRTGSKPGDQPPGHPILSGDFFTYADRDDHYWSGYFTSRSFYKHMDRVLESYHRAAEIIFSLMHATAKNTKYAEERGKIDLFRKLIESRQDLGLFQHHDGITGTAKDHVVIDYGERMLRSISNCQHVIERSAEFLLAKDKAYSYQDIISSIDSRTAHDSLVSKKVIIISNEPKTVIIYNSLAQERKQVVSVHVSEALVEVLDTNGKSVESQTSLIFNREQRPNSQKFELSFLATTPPLGISIYKIKRSSKGSPAKVEFLNENPPEFSNKAFQLKRGVSEDVVIQNHYMRAVFDPALGLLRTVALLSDKKEVNMEMKFMTYGTRNGMDKSGAYLFLPDGEAKEISVSNSAIVVTRGTLFTEIVAQFRYATCISRVYHVDVDEAKAIEIRNLVDIRESFNTELIMRIESGIQNGNREFFTDLNGFQMQKRKTLDKLPLQANFYPLPSSAFLQDTERRLTIHSAQPNGVASLKQGYIEVVLDRRLFQDDNRGLGQGVTDNKITPSNFLLVLEKFTKPKTQPAKHTPIAYPSQDSISLLHRHQHPMFMMTSSRDLGTTQYQTSFRGLKDSWPCNQFLLNLRTIEKAQNREPAKNAALLVHKKAYDCSFEHACEAEANAIKFSDAFGSLKVNSVEETSLTLMHGKTRVDPNSSIDVEPMEIKTFKIELNK